MNIVNKLNLRPWENNESGNKYPKISKYSINSNKNVALKVFLGVVTAMFSLLTIAYAGRMAYEDWRPVPQIELMWFNTAALVFASMSIEISRLSLKYDEINKSKYSFIASGIFTLTFLLGQIGAGLQLASLSFFSITNPAIAFFYLLAGLHGLHLLGGLTVCGLTLYKFKVSTAQQVVKESVDLCALYWHWLCLIWLLLFGLLFTGNNLELLLIICGVR
jgi:cytochrome c oxidase subunit 3